MAKASRGANGQSKSAQPKLAQPNSLSTKARQTAGKSRTRSSLTKATAPVRAGWATNLVFDVREPKLAVSLRLDADVLRFFRGFGAGYQTRINEVLKAFMQARGGAEPIGHAGVVGAKASRASAGNGKRASR